MKEEKIRLIEDLENIKNKNSNDLEMLLLQLRIDLLMSLKSKVKNDEETK